MNVNTGRILKEAKNVTFRAPDPTRPGEYVFSKERLHVLSNIAIIGVSGHQDGSVVGREKYITLDGQYDHFLTCRLTFAGDSADKVAAVIKPLLDKEKAQKNGQKIPFKAGSSLVISGVGRPWPQSGFYMLSAVVTDKDGNTNEIVKLDTGLAETEQTHMATEGAEGEINTQQIPGALL